MAKKRKRCEKSPLVIGLKVAIHAFQNLLIVLLLAAIMYLIALKCYQFGYHAVDGFWDNVNERLEEQKMTH